MPDETTTTATLDDVMTKLEAIEAKLDSISGNINGLGYIGGTATAVETNVNGQRVFVISPWPPEEETTTTTDDTEGTTGGE